MITRHELLITCYGAPSAESMDRFFIYLGLTNVPSLLTEKHGFDVLGNVLLVVVFGCVDIYVRQ